MLAIEKIKMSWTKRNRTPKSAVEREQYYKTKKIDDSVELSGRGIFVKEDNYIQMDNLILSSEAYQKTYANDLRKNCHTSERKEQEIRRKQLLRIQETERRNQGMFYQDVSEIHIPGIKIIPEDNEKYKIMWHSLEGCYKPVRKGRNEAFKVPDEEFSGRNICNETVFVLDRGEGGCIRYNYRCVGEEEPYYEYYCLFFVNAKHITREVFTQGNYVYEYEQLADLF